MSELHNVDQGDLHTTATGTKLVQGAFNAENGHAENVLAKPGDPIRNSEFIATGQNEWHTHTSPSPSFSPHIKSGPVAEFFAPAAAAGLSAGSKTGIHVFPSTADEVKRAHATNANYAWLCKPDPGSVCAFSAQATTLITGDKAEQGGSNNRVDFWKFQIHSLPPTNFTSTTPTSSKSGAFPLPSDRAYIYKR